jgi:hypothetical protein
MDNVYTQGSFQTKWRMYLVSILTFLLSHLETLLVRVWLVWYKFQNGKTLQIYYCWLFIFSSLGVQYKKT